MALTTLHIQNYLNKYGQFKGVYAIDDLPHEIYTKPFGIVINLDPSWKPGSHWTAIFCPSYGPVIYFDSFGLSPPENIKTYMERNSQRCGYVYNHGVYQGDLSIKCGYFCLLFLESCFANENFPLKKCKQHINEHKINKFYF